MGLFNRKLSLEDILNAIDGLSDEEKAQVKAKFDAPEQVEEVAEEQPSGNEANEPVEETPAEPSQFEEMAKSQGDDGLEEEPIEEQAEEPTEQPTETPMEEPQVELEQTEDGGEPLAEEPAIEEPAVEVPPEVQKQEQEQDEAQSAKIQALEEKVALLEEKLDQALSALDNKDFGLNPAVPEGGGEDHNRMSAVMRGYAGNDARKYY